MEATGDAKVILENKWKADIYGVDVALIPTLDHKIDKFSLPISKQKKNMTVMLLKRIKKQHDRDKNVKSESRTPVINLNDKISEEL